LLAKEIPQCNLAVSLHAPNNTIRNKIMPVNSAFKIEVLIEAIKKYIKVVKHGVSIQYTLMDKINDSEENAKELVKLLKGIDCQVVLIEYNQIAEHSYKTSKNFSAFKKILEINKINISLRLETGRSINAACGMLRSAHEK
jgi:23S rRNA (adenine2503-C2)-methyltransferase